MSIKKSPYDEKIFLRLKEIRKTAGLSQASFAEKIGLKQSSYNEIETGKRAPSEPVLASVSYRFQINEEWVKYGIGDKEKKFEVTQVYEPAEKKPRSAIATAILGLVDAMTEEEQIAEYERLSAQFIASLKKETP